MSLSIILHVLIRDPNAIAVSSAPDKIPEHQLSA